MTKKVLVGVGIIAGTALAAHLLKLLKGGKKASEKAEDCMAAMQKEIAEKVKEVRNLTEKKYDDIVDEVMSKYEAIKDVSASEFAAFSEEMKAHWKNISNAAKK